MRIIYRMRGLLGDATEEFIESLDSTTGTMLAPLSAEQSCFSCWLRTGGSVESPGDAEHSEAKHSLRETPCKEVLSKPTPAPGKALLGRVTLTSWSGSPPTLALWFVELNSNG